MPSRHVFSQQLWASEELLNFIERCGPLLEQVRTGRGTFASTANWTHACHTAAMVRTSTTALTLLSPSRNGAYSFFLRASESGLVVSGGGRTGCDVGLARDACCLRRCPRACLRPRRQHVCLPAHPAPGLRDILLERSTRFETRVDTCRSRAWSSALPTPRCLPH